MKRVYIITWLGNGNFGTSLQAFALYKKLSDCGYDVYHLMNFDVSFSWKSYIKYILTLNGHLKLRQWYDALKSTKQRKLYIFNKKNYKIKKVYTQKQYQRLLKSTDVFLTGSDQIWNTYHNYSPFLFLDFARKVKRAAYASSIGTSDIPEQYRNIIKDHLSKFKHIGVREKSAVNVLSKLLQRQDIVQVVDPTFLLSSNEWIEISNHATIEFKLPEKYILCYLIGNNTTYKQQLTDIRNKTGIYNIIIIPACENPNFNLEDSFVYSQAGPEEFVKLIEKSSIVCTDSFHATAISINLSKNFIEFMRFSETDKVSQNSRIHDLLEHYALTSRIYSQRNEEWLKDIDYDRVQIVLNQDRKESMKYLIKAIEQ